MVAVGALAALLLAGVAYVMMKPHAAARSYDGKSYSGPGDPKGLYAAGEAVDVHWGSSWWPGHVKQKNGDDYLVGYDGWDSHWDEHVDATRLRKPQATTSTGATESASGDPNASYVAGESVDIHWGSRWWPGKVVKLAGKRYHVTYDGWSESYDETVGPERLRQRATPSK